VKACQRHLNDLEEGHWVFDDGVADRVVKFFKLLKHSKGEWAGRPFHLEPWQQFILCNILAWKDPETGYRKYRTAYIEAGRKSGKTTLMAGLGLYLLLADDEPGAEIYSAATHRAQARLTHAEATRMAKSSPAIKREVRLMRDNILIPGTASRYEPLGADADTLDGLNVHAALVDELHAHKNREVWDVLETGTGSRRQPLMFSITTAGFDRETVCYKHNNYTRQVLDATIVDSSWFGIIYTIDKDDDWADESVWIKANPNIGVSKKLKDLQLKAEKAKNMPSALNAFLRKEMSAWTQSETKWLPREHWDACGEAVDEKGLQGRTCYGGLDLASNTDIAAFVLVFPPQVKGDKYSVLCRFWVPEEAMVTRSRRDRVPYDVWVRQGFIEATPGNVIDYEWILSQIDEDARKYDIKEIAFDRWGAAQIQTKLTELGGDEWMVQFGQGYRSMSPPTKECERLVLEHKLSHGGNPVLTWMADNMVVNQDPAGNIKPDRRSSREKIDGMVAMIMALDRSLRHEPRKKSIYEDRGLQVV